MLSGVSREDEIAGDVTLLPCICVHSRLRVYSFFAPVSRTCTPLANRYDSQLIRERVIRSVVVSVATNIFVLADIAGEQGQSKTPDMALRVS